MQDENQTSLDGEEEDIFIEETDIPNGFGPVENGTLPPASAIFDDNDQPKEKISTKDLPNWLSTFMGVDEGEVPPESALVSGVEDQPRETGLEPGTIPSWVKAMRPVDSIKPDPAKQQEADRRFEEEGPLAGIRGIIPGSEVEFKYRFDCLAIISLNGALAAVSISAARLPTWSDGLLPEYCLLLW
jgi:hypothetical protein